MTTGADGAAVRSGRALVVGKFAPFHDGHRLLVTRAEAAFAEVLVLVYAVPDFVAMPQAMRAGWIRALHPGVDVRTPVGAPPDQADDATHRAFVAGWLVAHGLAVAAVVTSEAYGDGFAASLGVPHLCVDPARTRVPVSGSAIRAAPHAWRHALHPLVRADLDPRPGRLDRRGDG